MWNVKYKGQIIETYYHNPREIFAVEELEGLEIECIQTTNEKNENTWN
jgi:hypothetical protein